MAYELKMSVEDVLDFSVSEIQGWREFFQIRAAEMEKARRKNV